MVLNHALSEYVYFNTKKNGKNSNFDFFVIFHYEPFDGSLQSCGCGGIITFTKKWRFGYFKFQNGRSNMVDQIYKNRNLVYYFKEAIFSGVQ